MFAKALVLYFLSIFTILVAAAPGGGGGGGGGGTPTVTTTATPTATTISQCNTGPVQCCNTVEAASTPGAGLILGLLGVLLKDLSVLVGLGCTPITVIGIGGGADCSQQPVCCENNTFQGVINIGCSPITL